MAKKAKELVNGKLPFGKRDLVSYAAGDLGCNMSFALKSSIMAIFWTQYMALGEEMYAFLLMIVQVWDAINDPLLGSLFDADKRKYKRGKFKTYIFIGALGLLFSGLFFFLPLPNAPKAMRCILFVLGYVLWDAFYTIANVPYGSMMSVITTVGSERAQLSTWRSIGSMVGNVIPMVVLPMICYDASENLKGEVVFIAAIIMGIVGLLCFIFMLKTTTIRVEENSVTISEKKQKFNVFKAMGNFMKNRPAVGATVAAMGMFIGMQGAATAVTVIFQSYYNNVKISGIVQLFAMIPIVVFTPLARKAVARFGKKELATFGSIVSMVAGLGLFVVMPKNTNLDLVIYIVCQLIFSLGLGIYSTVSWAMMGDAIDYNEWKTGKREEGTVYSLHSFFRKLAQGIGPSLVLIIMVAFGYVGADEGNQAWQVAVNMRYIVAATYMFSAILQFIGLGLIYNLDKKTLAKMNTELGRDESTAKNDAAITENLA